MSAGLTSKCKYGDDTTISELLYELRNADWDDAEGVARIASSLCYHSEYMARFLTLHCGTAGWNITARVDASGATAYCVSIPRRGDMPAIFAVNQKMTLALATAMVNVALAHESMKNDDFKQAVESEDDEDIIGNDGEDDDDD